MALTECTRVSGVAALLLRFAATLKPALPWIVVVGAGAGVGIALYGDGLLRVAVKHWLHGSAAAPAADGQRFINLPDNILLDIATRLDGHSLLALLRTCRGLHDSPSLQTCLLEAVLRQLAALKAALQVMLQAVPVAEGLIQQAECIRHAVPEQTQGLRLGLSPILMKMEQDGVEAKALAFVQLDMAELALQCALTAGQRARPAGLLGRQAAVAGQDVGPAVVQARQSAVQALRLQALGPAGQQQQQQEAGPAGQQQQQQQVGPAVQQQQMMEGPAVQQQEGPAVEQLAPVGAAGQQAGLPAGPAGEQLVPVGAAAQQAGQQAVPGGQQALQALNQQLQALTQALHMGAMGQLPPQMGPAGQQPPLAGGPAGLQAVQLGSEALQVMQQHMQAMLHGVQAGEVEQHTLQAMQQQMQAVCQAIQAGQQMMQAAQVQQQTALRLALEAVVAGRPQGARMLQGALQARALRLKLLARHTLQQCVQAGQARLQQGGGAELQLLQAAVHAGVAALQDTAGW